MNDPHVERLRYRLNVDFSLFSLENPPPLFQEFDGFRIRLEDEILTVEMKEHHASIHSAKEKVEEFIKDWSIYAALDFDWDILKFEYECAAVIDRKPAPKLPGQTAVMRILPFQCILLRLQVWYILSNLAGIQFLQQDSDQRQM
jgi:hypothetical protein